MPDVSSNDSGATVAQGPNGLWHWRCHQCGWVGLDLHAAAAAEREAARHECPVDCRCRKVDGAVVRYSFACPVHGEGAQLARVESDLEAQLAEAQEQNRMLTARCDELAGERDALRPVVAMVGVLLGYMTPHHWATLSPAVIVPSLHALRNAYRDQQARCSDEDCQAPLRDGKTNHAVGCRVEQDEVTGGE